MSKLVTTQTMQLAETHNYHIHQIMLPYVMDIVEELECTSVQFEAEALPNVNLSVQAFIAAMRSASWKCSLYVNNHFAFHYGLRYELTSTGQFQVKHWLQAPDDKRYFHVEGDVEELDRWEDVQESIRFRLQKLINEKLPELKYTAEQLRILLDATNVTCSHYNHEASFFKCNDGSMTYLLKLANDGSVYRQDGLQMEKYLKIADLENYYCFSPDRMRQLLSRDAYLQFVYEDLKKKHFIGARNADIRILEQLFNAYVLDDYNMADAYAQLF